MVDIIDKMFSNENSRDNQNNELSEAEKAKREDRKTAGFGQMSNNIVELMSAIATNKGIRRLLYLNQENPFHPDYDKRIPTKSEILSSKSKYGRIKPVSFNPEATIEDRTEIRIYYNIGRVDGSGKHVDANIHIDIICAKDLWLIEDAIGRSKIRPYEILSRISDEIGAQNRNNISIGAMSQFQMLSVNEQFDAIRVYYNIKDIAGDIAYVEGS